MKIRSTLRMTLLAPGRACTSTIALIAVIIAIASQAATAANLVINGDFEGGSTPAGLSGPFDGLADTVPNGWTRFETFFGAPPVENSQLGPFVPNGPSAPGVTGMEFFRTFGGVSGDYTTIEQSLNISVANFSTLTLQADVQVLSHNLQAGGTVTPAFEWPLMLQIDYLDTGNSPQIWRHGFYVNPPGDGARLNDPGQGLIPFYNDTQVTANQWNVASFNLLTELPQAQTVTKIRVGGSGWDFHGFVDNISIVPEPSRASLLFLGASSLLLHRRRKRLAN